MATEKFENLRDSIVTLNKPLTIISAADLSRTKQDVSGWVTKGGLIYNKGWAVCDGSTYDPLEFPDLHEALGSPALPADQVVPNGIFRTNEIDLTFSSTPTGWSLISAKGIAYTDSDGNYRLKFNIQATKTASTSAAATISGVTFVGTEACSMTSGVNTEMRAFVSGGAVNVRTTASDANFYVSGDVQLASKPGFFDANLEDNPIIATSNNITSTSIGLPDPTATQKGLLTLDQNAEGNRNYIINGGMDFWQRNTSQTTDGYGSVDRFNLLSSGSSHSVTRENFAIDQTDVEGNPDYYFRNVVTSVAGASNFSVFRQDVEFLKTTAGKTMTLSFYAKADASKDISVTFYQGFGTGGSPSSQNKVGQSKIAITTSWEKYTFTIDIDDLTGKTIGTNNDDYLRVQWWLDAGSDFDSDTDTLGQQSGTFDIYGLKLEQGSQASKFTRAGSTYAGELALCQYYLKRFNSVSSGNQPSFVDVIAISGTRAIGTMFIGNTMRDIPTFERADLSLFSVNGSSPTSLGVRQITKDLAQIDIEGSGFVVGQSYRVEFNGSSSYVQMDAEL
ncbi:MAG: hypothetical protein GY744_15870 [Gammaproteobacteria bacterium]|nr:hypothetical protein [Gammaproteobacteria bacterium]